MSDAYASFNTGYLVQALRVIEEIIDAIEKLTPSAFGPPFAKIEA